MCYVLDLLFSVENIMDLLFSVENNFVLNVLCSGPFA